MRKGVWVFWKAFCAFLVAVPYTARALSVDTSIGTSLGLGTLDLVDVTINLIRWALGLLGVLAVLMIVLGGFQWLISGGDDERIAAAQRTISGAVIGIIIILLAWVAVRFVLTTTVNVSGGSL